MKKSEVVLEIKCIVIENDENDKEILEGYISKIPYLKLTGSFLNPLDALVTLQSQRIDVIFSETTLPELNGIDFVKSLKDPYYFIFLSFERKYAIEGYDLDVVDYIIKPYSFARFLRAANRVRKMINTGINGSYSRLTLKIKHENRTIILKMKEIHYIEGMKDYVKIYTPHGFSISHVTLKELELILPKENFLRVQKSYIVNLDKVFSISVNQIVLKPGDAKIPIGGLHYKKQLFDIFDIDY